MYLAIVKTQALCFHSGVGVWRGTYNGPIFPARSLPGASPINSKLDQAAGKKAPFGLRLGVHQLPNLRALCYPLLRAAVMGQLFLVNCDCSLSHQSCSSRNTVQLEQHSPAGPELSKWPPMSGGHAHWHWAISCSSWRLKTQCWTLASCVALQPLPCMALLVGMREAISISSHVTLLGLEAQGHRGSCV